MLFRSFIVRLYLQVLSLDALCTDRVTPPALSVLYCMERERPHHRSPSPSIYSRHRYASPSFPTQKYTERLFWRFLQGTGIGSTYILATEGEDIVFNQKLERITNSFFACTLALNVVCTGAFPYCILPMACTKVLTYSLRSALASSGLIAFRIWRTQKQTRDAKMGSNLIKVSVIVIESGVFHHSLPYGYDARQSHT